MLNNGKSPSDRHDNSLETLAEGPSSVSKSPSVGGRSRRANVIANGKQIMNDAPAAPPSAREQTPTGGHTLRGSCSRRAAEEDEHVVVRGEKGDNLIESTRVSIREQLHADTPNTACPSPEHHEDPPDGFDFDGDVVMDIEDNREDTHRGADGSSTPV